MADNEDIDPTTPQDIYNLFVAVDLSSCSSSYSDKYELSCVKKKVIRSSILSAG